MASFRDSDRALFPIGGIAGVIQLFRGQLANPEPDLALLSIVVGTVENSLTCRTGSNAAAAAACSERHRSAPKDGGGGGEAATTLPSLELGTIETLYIKFRTLLLAAVEAAAPRSGAEEGGGASCCSYATRDVVKRVSDVIWNSLTRSYYKDRAHLQSLYSYLTGNKLDCFGVAFAVVAGCQALGYNDVHLALSEDHAWVVFGENGTETAEVTWHGKGNEDKRGQEVGKGVSARSWLYVNNRPVICTRQMEVVALVSAINPSLNATHDAFEVALLQQELLWLLYDLGHLRKYPMAIGNLGDLEEIAPSSNRLHCSALFEEAITSARLYYSNQHVYPYTYQGGYYYRNKMYGEAFESWANASDVIRQYNYSRDDEEIYKEFLEIANELIPHIMKVESSGFSAATTILKKPDCFAHLLRFYDGICQWEEGSATPVLHIGWAKPLVNTISKFEADVRAQVNIVCGEDVGKTSREELDPPSTPITTTQLLVIRRNGANSNNCLHLNNNNNNNNNNTTTTNNNNNHSSCYEKESSDVSLLLGGTVGATTVTTSLATNCHPSIEALTAACSEKILNPEYLIQGDGSPFVGEDDAPSTVENDQNNSSDEEQQPSTSKEDTSKEDESIAVIKEASTLKSSAIQQESSGKSNIHQESNKKTEPTISQSSDTNVQEKGKDLIKKIADIDPESDTQLSMNNNNNNNDDGDEKQKNGKQAPTIVLYSQKMKELKDLLLAEKLNTHAISLHLTAQSQVQIGKKGYSHRHDESHNSSGGGGGVGVSVRPKRARRE